jgi:hypothetical protein
VRDVRAVEDHRLRNVRQRRRVELSVAHTEADADSFVAVFEELAADLTS